MAIKNTSNKEYLRVIKENKELKSTNAKLKLQIRTINKRHSHKAIQLNGEEASEIAHEINNPINLVSNSINILDLNVHYIIELVDLYEQLKKEPNNTSIIEKIEDFENEINLKLTAEELLNSVKRITKAIYRVQEISENLSYRGKAEKRLKFKLDVNQSIKNTLTMIDLSYGKNPIELKTEYGNLPSIKSIKGKINQVFTNLIENAIEAIREKNCKGLLFIKTYCNKDKIVIKINDNGIGMSNKTKDRVFEKFYTTKSNNKGTGLGMSITKRIIEEHEGNIEIESKLNAGTTITVNLPIK